MTGSDYQEFCEFMRRISKVTAIPNGKSIDEMIDALFMLLNEYPLEAVKAAVMRHCEANKFFPMLADIMSQIKGTPDERAMMAWGLVMKARREYRQRVGIRFPHPAIHFALEQMGGWAHVYKTLTNENEDFKAKTFVVYYKLGEKCATWENVCDYFPSEVERHTLKAGRVLARKVYNVATDMLVPDSQLEPLEPLEAWASVHYKMLLSPQRMREEGATFEDPAINYAVDRMGGLGELRASLNEETESRKLREFRRYYTEYKASELPA